MFKILFIACMLALVAAEPKPKPDVFYSTYTAAAAPLAAYTVPAAYVDPLTYSAYTVPVADYSAYTYASPYAAYYAFRR